MACGEKLPRRNRGLVSMTVSVCLPPCQQFDFTLLLHQQDQRHPAIDYDHWHTKRYFLCAVLIEIVPSPRLLCTHELHKLMLYQLSQVRTAIAMPTSISQAIVA